MSVPIVLAACGDDGNHGTPQDAAADASPDASPDAPEGPGAVTVQLTPKVGSAPFTCGQTYPTMGEEMTTITPRDFRIYVSDIHLIRADGEHVALARRRMARGSTRTSRCSTSRRTRAWRGAKKQRIGSPRTRW